MKKLFKNLVKILLVIMIVPLFGCSQIQKTTEDQPNSKSETLMPAETETLMPAETENSQIPQNDSSWSQLGSLEDIFMRGGSTKISVAPDGTLYVLNYKKDGIQKEDGSFPQTFAKWNGLFWSEVGTDVGVGAGDVRTFTVTSDGIIYAAIDIGTDENTGDLYEKISKWDGNSWVDIGNVDGSIWCMQLDFNGALYVAGGFLSIGEVDAKNVAKWDGNNWSAVGLPDSQYFGEFDVINKIAIAPSGSLYVGHLGEEIPFNSSNLYQWDGAAWTPIKLGPEINAWFYSILVNNDGALFTLGNKGENGTVFFAKLDNTIWSFIDTEFMPVELIGFSNNGTLYIKTRSLTQEQDSTASIFSWDGEQLLYQFDVSDFDPIAFSPVKNEIYINRYSEDSNKYEIFQLKLKNQ